MELIAEILEYLVGDLHCDYEDGSFEWFDATKLKILQPKKQENKIIYIYHNDSIPLDNLWHKKGIIVKLKSKYKEKDCIIPKPNELIYSDAILINQI